MTKSELIDKIAESAQVSKTDASQALNTFLTEIQESLVREGKFSLVGLGSFFVEEAKERKGHNPRTGAPLIIPARMNVKFKPSSLLKQKLQ